MGRSLRIEYVGAIYHVMNRGIEGRDVLLDRADMDFFLGWLGKVSEKCGWKIHAWTLMTNHYHLLIETRRPTLVRGMQMLNAEYTRRFNRRYRRRGPLFQGRYKACLVEGKAEYYRTVSDYIHLNLVRAGGCRNVAALAKSPRTSVGCYVRGKFPEWMEWRKVMGSFGHRKLGVGERRAYEEHLGGRIELEQGGGSEWAKLRRSWWWGSEHFAERVRLGLSLKRGESAAEDLWQRGVATETEEEKAERILRQWEKKMGKAAADEGVGEKYVMGLVVRERSCVSVAWLVERLKMKSSGALRRGMSVKRGSTEYQRMRKLMGVDNK